MEEMTALIESTLADKYVLGLLDTEEMTAFERLLGIYPPLQQEVLLARQFLAAAEGVIPPPEQLRHWRLEWGRRLPRSSSDMPAEEYSATRDKNAEILLQTISPLFITEHKYVRIAFWSLVILVILLLLTTIAFYVALNWSF